MTTKNVTAKVTKSSKTGNAQTNLQNGTPAAKRGRKPKEFDRVILPVGFERRDASTLLEMIRTGIVPRAALPEGYVIGPDGFPMVPQPSDSAEIDAWKNFAHLVQALPKVTDDYRLQNAQIVRIVNRLNGALQA